MSLAEQSKTRFILENTSISSPPHVPEIKLHLADEAHELWHKTEEELEQIGLQPPFWAFAWAGGQALARYILDNPQLFKEKRVLDFASGSGLVGIAAKMAGAMSVICVDIDPFCESAITLNGELNKQDVSVIIMNMLADNIETAPDFDLLVAGDIFYDQQMARKVWPFLQDLKKRGVEILVGDPGRAYLPKTEMEKIAEFQVPVTRALEDSEVKRTSVWRLI